MSATLGRYANAGETSTPQPSATYNSSTASCLEVASSDAKPLPGHSRQNFTTSAKTPFTNKPNIPHGKPESRHTSLERPGNHSPKRDRIDWDLKRLDDDEGVAALEKERAKKKQRHKEKDNRKKRGDVNDDWFE
jgi:hypothetical protein